MIYEINIENYTDKVVLKSDIAGQDPMYVFDDKEKIYYSKDLKELLSKVKDKLKIWNKGISFLLKSGVIPTPYSVYQDLYILSIGNTLEIEKKQNSFILSFSNKFPFLREKNRSEGIPDEEKLLDLLAQAAIKKIDKEKRTFLFHSAGKDSNTLAFALSQKGFTDIKCVSHRSKGEKDESAISKKVADKLGFEHQSLIEPKEINKSHIDAIEEYFINIPFPVLDEVSLAYPIYNTQEDFKNSNIIDGMGNDVYLGHIPARSEYRFANYLSKFSFLKPLANNLRSENYFNIIGSNKIEWVGLIGFMNKDCLNIYGDFSPTDSYWKDLEKESSKLNYLDLRSKIRGGVIDQEIFMRKVRNFAHINNANMIFPWADTNVAEYFYNIDNKYLFDKENLKNKLLLREILKKRLNLDSDKLGKLGFTFNFWKILRLMKDQVRDEILSCKLWDEKNIEIVFNRLFQRALKNDRFSNRPKALIQRLYLLSAWYNKNRYINR